MRTMPIDVSADTLIYSDDPETVYGPPRMPIEGVLYAQEVAAGRTRVFYYHVNAAVQARTFGVRVKNVSATSPTTITARTFVSPPLGGQNAWLRTGHETSVGFLRTLATGAWSAPQTLQPGEAVVLGTVSVTNNELASGYVDVDADGAAPLKFSVVAATSASRIAGVAAAGPAFPPDNHGRCGVYDVSGGDETTHHYRVGGTAAAQPVPGTKIPNQRVPADLPPGHSSDATYAVFTQVDATLENATGAPATVAAYLTANGGNTPATCWIDGDIVEVGIMRSGDPPRPRYKLREYPLEPGQTAQTTIVATVDPSGSGPLLIEIDANDDGPAPGDQAGRSIVYVPGGAPWQLT
jgi:hypothetical protein